MPWKNQRRNLFEARADRRSLVEGPVRTLSSRCEGFDKILFKRYAEDQHITRTAHKAAAA